MGLCSTKEKDYKNNLNISEDKINNNILNKK